jgi:DNA-binding response OmpR family regulator
LAGADDFMCKPFSMRELMARIIVCMRRTINHETQPHERNDMSESISSIQINQIQRTVHIDGQHIETTFSEYELLLLFYFNPGRVFTRENLITALGGEDAPVSDRSIDVHITKLRKKIEKDPKHPKHILTVWGVGYKFMM